MSGKKHNKADFEKYWAGFWSNFAEKDYSFVEKLPDKERLLQRTVEILKGYDPILDAGCGPGKLVVNLARQGKTVYGIDYSKGMLKKAKSRVSKIPEIKDRVFLSEQSVTKLNFEDSYFGASVSINVLFALLDPYDAIDESYRVLKKGGIYLVSSPLGNAKFDSKLLKKIKEDIKSKGLDYKKFKGAMAFNQQLFAKGGVVFTPSRKKLEKMLESRGFKIKLSEDAYYGGNFLVAGQKI